MRQLRIGAPRLRAPTVKSDRGEPRLSLEVRVSWGDSLLEVLHLTPPRSFFVGEQGPNGAPLDFVLPAGVLGTDYLPLVSVQGEQALVVIPTGAELSLDAGSASLTEEGVRQSFEPSPLLAGARTLSLPVGARLRLRLGAFSFHVALVAAGDRTPRAVLPDRTGGMYLGLSAAAVAAIVGSLALFTPPLGLLDDEAAHADRLYAIQQFLSAAAERERLEKQEQRPEAPPGDSGAGEGQADAARGDAGKLGKRDAEAVPKRAAVEGPKDNPNPELPKELALAEARTFGILSFLTGAVNAPTAPWGAELAAGTDPLSAIGNMWADDLGDAAGSGGLGLSGGGQGAGGFGKGIGAGVIGTCGGVTGCTGDGRFGVGVGRTGGGHAPRAPRMGVGRTEVSGRLPPEVIQRVVRQNFGRFRLCYERGLTRNPNLEGRVAARFVIGRDGSVQHATSGDSDLPDADVVQCVVRAYYGLSFPQPEHGVVTVTYPIAFSPG